MDRVAGGRRRPHRGRRALAQRRAARPRHACSTSRHRSGDGGGARQRSAPSSSASPRTRSSTSRRKRRLTSSRSTLPPLHTKFEGRHALSSCAATTTGPTSPALRPYIREYRPVLIGVDGGADALLELGLKPDIIIGDFDSVSAKGLALRRRARAPRAPRRARARAREPARVGRRVPGVRGRGHERGRRHAARLRVEGAADRRRRHARHDGRVPRQGPPGHGVDLPHPAAARPDARRRRRA